MVSAILCWRMSQEHLPDYFSVANPAALRREYPLGEDFTARFAGMSRDELRAIQEGRFRRCLEQAWATPFYRRLWSESGLEPGDVRSLEDLPKLPIFSKADLMKSVERHPPFGDYHRQREGDPEAPPAGLVMQTTSGTTGAPQPIFFGPRSRELQALMVARAWLLQGLRSSDVMHSSYAHGMVNAGHFVREAALHYTRTVLLSAGAGNETPSLTQTANMARFKATVLVGFADYLRKLADTARRSGLEPGRDICIRMISTHLGMTPREDLGEAWACDTVYDWYGVGDTGLIAAEGPDLDGMHVMEDAHFVEIVEPSSQLAASEGEPGDVVCTCLYKDDAYPIIRFNTRDLSAWLPGENALGLPFARIAGFLGRSDSMVKYKGINFYPEAAASVLRESDAYAGDYICILDGEEFVIEVEVQSPQQPGLGERLQALIRQRLGVRVPVRLCAPGSLAALTGSESRQKPRRLIRR
ncbi:phenylacetate--CoA ligase family protein [Candidatus Foliamicus sp.]